MRNTQEIGKKGSLKWIQEYINNKPEELNRLIGDKIKWLSPLKAAKWFKKAADQGLEAAIEALEYISETAKN
jgi:TPR repeat protein